MPTSNKPDYEIRDGGSKTGVDVDEALVRIVVDERLDQAAVATIELKDEDSEFSGGSKFKLGNDLQIDLGYTDGGKKNVFKGQITGRRGTYPRRGPSTFVVTAMDRFHLLRRNRRAISYLQQKDSDIASAVASRAGLSATTDTTPLQLDNVMQVNQSDADFVLERAKLYGYEVFVDDKKLVFQKPKLDAAAVATLEWHKNLKHFSPVISLTQQEKVKVSAWDMKSKKGVSAEAGAGQELSLMGATKSGASVMAEKLSSPVMHRPQFPADNMDQMQAFAKGIFQERSQKYVTGSGTGQGEPAVRRGTVVEVKGIGPFLSGKYYVSGVIHTLLPGSGYTTTFFVRKPALESPGAPPSSQPPPAQTPEKSEPPPPEDKDVVFLVKDDTGAPLDGLPYLLRKPDGTTRSGKLGADGKVEEKKVGAGVYVLELESVAPPRVPAKVLAGEAFKIGADVTGLAPGGKVEFQVFEPYGLAGDPLATVSGATTEENPHWAEAEWTYDHSSLKEKVHGSSLVVVAKAGTTAVSLSRPFEVAQKLEVTLKDKNGKPLANRRVLLRAARGPNFPAQTDDEGKVEAEVPPGDYRVDVLD